MGNQDLTTRLHWCFLIMLPWFLYSLPSLISNSLNLPVGTQKSLWKLMKAISFNQERFFNQEPHKVLLRYTFVQFQRKKLLISWHVFSQAVYL